MRKLIVKNYWMMMVAWIVAINGYEVIGMLLGLAASVMLMRVGKKLNLWRLLAVCLLCYSTSLLFLLMSSIPYYFPKLYIFMTGVSLNMAVTSEYLCYLKKRFIIPILLFNAIGMLISFLLIKIVPDADYSLFTKGNLYLMSSLIFLPYLIIEIAWAVKKTIVYRKNELVLSKQRNY